MRKIILVVTAISAIILGGFLIWFLFRKQATKSPVAKLEQLTTNKKITFQTLSGKEDSILYYDPAENKIFEFFLKENRQSPISDLFLLVNDIKWSPDAKKTILKISNIQPAHAENPLYTTTLPEGEEATYFYEIGAKEPILLSRNIQEVTWTADGQKIVYHYLDKAKGVNNLSIADPDGKNWKKIIDLKEEKVFLSTFPTGEIAYTASETTDSFSAIKTDGSGERTIKLPILINVNKLAWASDGKSLIAAVREQNKTTDTFYKINLETNQKQEIQYKSDTPIDAKNLMLTKDDKTLYFTSDDYLYKMKM